MRKAQHLLQVMPSRIVEKLRLYSASASRAILSMLRTGNPELQDTWCISHCNSRQRRPHRYQLRGHIHPKKRGGAVAASRPSQLALVILRARIVAPQRISWFHSQPVDFISVGIRLVDRVLTLLSYGALKLLISTLVHRIAAALSVTAE